LVTFKKIWKVNFITPLLEPMFYILVFGLGFSRMIGNVQCSETNTILRICYLIVFFLVFSFLALVSMKKRLIN
jgi:uncharacterized membrane protein YbjE (DUF340 family)